MEHDGVLEARELTPKVRQREVLLAELDGELAGFLRLDHLWSLLPFVAQVRVLEPYRRRGVGRALVGAACQHAREIGWGFLLSSTTAGEADPRAWRWFLNDVVTRRRMRARWQGSSGERSGGVVSPR